MKVRLGSKKKWCLNFLNGILQKKKRGREGEREKKENLDKEEKEKPEWFRFPLLPNLQRSYLLKNKYSEIGLRVGVRA